MDNGTVLYEMKTTKVRFKKPGYVLDTAVRFLINSITVALLLFPGPIFAQSDHYKTADVSAVEKYFNLARILKGNQEPPAKNWTDLFHSPAHYAYAMNGSMDTAGFKDDMRLIYMPSLNKSLDTAKLSEAQRYHLQYQRNEKLIRFVMKAVQRKEHQAQIKAQLFPFLPERLQVDSLFPQQFYKFTGYEDATGGPGYVLNDMLLAARLYKVSPGILSAHEAFHSIILASQKQRAPKNADYNDANFHIFMFLSLLAQEGIADMIDKPFLLSTASPFYHTWGPQYQDEERIAPVFIAKLDSMLTASWKEKHSLSTIQDLLNSGLYSKLGGHIPGRYMGMVIRKHGLLPDLIQHADDPMAFIRLYQQATGGKAFTKESLQFMEYACNPYFR